MNRILVAINFSDQANELARYALRMAQYFEVELNFVYVIPENEIVEKLSSYKRENEVNMFLKRLDKFISTHYAKQYHSIPLQTHVRVGSPTKEISELATSILADLVMVGKDYHYSISLIDDTADALISLSACPVMTIPKGAEFHRIDKIIYASAFLLEDCAALIELQKWVDKFDGEVICIHVCDDAKELSKAKLKMAIFNKLFPQEKIKFRCFIADNDKAIERYSQLSHSELLCSMHRNRNMFQNIFMPSKSKKLTDKSTQPMVVFNQNLITVKE